MPQTTVMLFRESSGKIPVNDWLDLLEEREPKAYAKCVDRIIRLSQMGFELRRPLADFLRDGIYELRVRDGNVQYRLLYFFSGKNAVVLSHGLTKKDKVPDVEIDKAINRKARVEKNLERHTAEWSLE